MKRIAAFIGLLHRWNVSVVTQWFLLWAFYRLWYCLLLTAQGDWKFHTRFLSLVPSVQSQQKHVLQDLSQPFKSAEILMDGVRHLKRHVNKAESFRYTPSEPEPLWWSTDSQKYHCWHYCGASWETRAEAFLLYYFQLSLECVAVNMLFTNTFTSSSSLVPVWCWLTFVLKKDTVICAEMIGFSTVFSVLCCLRGQKTSYDDY